MWRSSNLNSVHLGADVSRTGWEGVFWPLWFFPSPADWTCYITFRRLLSKLAAVGVYPAEPELGRPAVGDSSTGQGLLSWPSTISPTHLKHHLSRPVVWCLRICYIWLKKKSTATFDFEVWLSETVDVLHRLHMILGRNLICTLT